MTQLLLSVRNLEEARLLPPRGVGILDIKEPNRGALGRADQQTISSIQKEFDGVVSVSAALGELVDTNEDLLECLPPVEFAKFGLSRMRDVPEWKSLWMNRIAQLPEGTAPVAVIYADWISCGAPPPERVVSAAIEAACPAILIDTFEKSQGSLLQWLTFDELKRITRQVRSTSAKWVLAGGLREFHDLQKMLQLQPDFIGVRGAICEEGRASKISPIRLKEFFRQFSDLIESNDVAESRSNESESIGSESRNEGITH